MKKLALIMLLAVGSLAAKAQFSIPWQEIAYNVNYHWGLIDVMIARGTVTLQADDGNFYGTLDGTSIPWEGRIMCVSDTLRAQMSYADGRLGERVDYQNGWYRRVPVSLFRSSAYNPDDPAYFKSIDGRGAYSASANSMEAVTVTSDMIGMYYFAHVIDFDAMQPGERLTIAIDGPYSRELVITYQGRGTYTGSGSTYPTYDCTFEYAYGGSMSGYPVECRISMSDRIPVYLAASLPVGKVEMLYDPN